MAIPANQKSIGLSYKWLDLHVHTPASYDFANRAADAAGRRKQVEEVIQKAKSVGLHGIAVTDHNVVTSIDEAKEIGRSLGLTVFPGFEISCHGSADGPIHVLGVFDPSRSQTDLERVLGKLEVKGGGENALTHKSVNDVVDIIRDAGGLPVLAHANSTHGALNDIRGNSRIGIVQNPKLIAVEATAADFAKPPGKRLLDLLDGTDPNYRRKLAVFSGSDNPAASTGHSAEGVGRRFSAFKMGELTIESLRQCFEDRDTRILQFEDLSVIADLQPRIIEVRIEGGFLDGQTIQFHPGMTSVIGATGTGKSLLIEFLRFAFDKSPHPSLHTEHKAKLQKQLREGGTIHIKFADSSNEEYELSKTYSAKGNREAVCVNCSTGNAFDGDVGSIFPILFYSQNEILEVTRDARAQLKLLDSFRDRESRLQKLQTLNAELRELDRNFVNAFVASRDLPSLQKNVKTLDERINKCAKQLKNTAAKEYGEFSKLEEQRAAAVNRQSDFDDLLQLIQDANDSLEVAVANLPGDDETETPEAEVVAQIGKAQEAITELIYKAQSIVEKAQKNAARDIASWERKVKFGLTRKAYDKSLQQKTKLTHVESQRQTLQAQRETASRSVQTSQAAKNKLNQLRQQRLAKLQLLKEAREADFNERDDQAKLITDRSAKKLRIQIHKQADRDAYKKRLLELKVGSYAEEQEIDRIISRLSTVEFVELVLSRDAKTLSKAVGINESKANNIINVLLEPDTLSKTLALQYDCFPGDRIEIEYRKQDGTYHKIDELSMGQKADALLMIALGDSKMPVIIDQPEDALDLSSIWDDICKTLRVSKSARQFVFTTHNSSVAVASDSDQFIVMNATATEGWVEEAGTIDQRRIKDRVVEHLEGGTESYELKRRKYNLDR